NSQRWWNPDLKEYSVEITLDQTPKDLKPGLTANVQIFVDKLNHVLAVPLSSIYVVDKQNYVFCRDGENLRHHVVTLGATNDTHAQITTGLTPGDQVLILGIGQGRELLEKAGADVSPATRPAHSSPPSATPTPQNPMPGHASLV